MDEYKGREVKTRIYAIIDDKGWWTVTQEIIQRRTTDPKQNLEDWESKEISASAVAETLERAQSQCVLTIMAYLESVQGDIFSDPELQTSKEKVQ